MKKAFFLSTGILTSFMMIGVAGCSDNDGRTGDTSNLNQNGTVRSSAAQGAGSDAGASASIGNGSGDASSEYMRDPTGSGPGE